MPCCLSAFASVSVTLCSPFVFLNLLPCYAGPSCLSIYLSVPYSTLHLSGCGVGGCVGTSVGVTSAAENLKGSGVESVMEGENRRDAVHV